jgi:hypothetical protein
MKLLMFRGVTRFIPLFFLIFLFPDRAFSSECSQEKISLKIDQIVKSENYSKRWEAIDKAISPSMKECIFSRMAEKFKFQIIDEKKIEFRKNIFVRVSGVFVDAPASDHGWATVFQKKFNKSSKESQLLKIAFSVSPTGELDLIDLFSIEKKEGEIYFSSIDDMGMTTFPKECIGCHEIKKSEGYIFGKYKLN